MKGLAKKMGPVSKAISDRMAVRRKKEGSGMRRGLSAAHITTKGTKRIRQMKDIEMGA